MARTRLLPSPDDTHRLARAVAEAARPGDTILLEGPLGAGKSEFARAFIRARANDSALEVPSPTYTLVQTYETPDGPVHHLDLWRAAEADLAELGWDDLAGIALVEWPDRLGAGRPADALTLGFAVAGEISRLVTVSGWPSEGLAERLPWAREPAAFLAAHGRRLADATALAGDASARRYFRLPDCVFADMLPGPAFTAFLDVGRHLAGIGLSVPRVIAADEAAGLLLEEDFGTGQASLETFEAAVDALAVMQRAPAPSFLPAWDTARMATLARDTFADWWWPAMHGGPMPAGDSAALLGALEDMLAPFADETCFVHRDFHAENLILLPERAGPAAAGILDFQDAAIGPPFYDVASLIHDPRRQDTPALQDRLLARFLAARPALDPDRARAGIAICAVQRLLRLAGHWIRLERRDRRPEYRAHGPRTWAMLTAMLNHPACAALAATLDRLVPARDRRNPPLLSIGTGC